MRFCRLVFLHCFNSFKIAILLHLCGNYGDFKDAIIYPNAQNARGIIWIQGKREMRLRDLRIKEFRNYDLRMIIDYEEKGTLINKIN